MPNSRRGDLSKSPALLQFEGNPSLVPDWAGYYYVGLASPKNAFSQSTASIFKKLSMDTSFVGHAEIGPPHTMGDCSKRTTHAFFISFKCYASVIATSTDLVRWKWLQWQSFTHPWKWCWISGHRGGPSVFYLPFEEGWPQRFPKAPAVERVGRCYAPAQNLERALQPFEISLDCKWFGSCW